MKSHYVAWGALVSSKTPPAITDLTGLPLILNLLDIAGIYRKSPSTIRRMLQAGTFRPRPWDTNPFLWTRDDVAADLKRRREEDHSHLVVAARARRRATAKAALETRGPRRRPAAS